MATFTVTTGGTLGAAGGTHTEAPVAEQTAVSTDSATWDGVVHGKGDVGVIADE